MSELYMLDLKEGDKLILVGTFGCLPLEAGSCSEAQATVELLQLCVWLPRSAPALFLYALV